MIKSPFTGGCYCGAVRYECTAKPEQIEMFNCHCRDCQSMTGGGHTPVVFVPASTFQFTRGTPRYFSTDSDQAGPQSHKRSFCPECGSRLTGGEFAGAPNIGMCGGSLDDPSVFKPAADFWVSDAQPWDLLHSSTAKFDKVPS